MQPDGDRLAGEEPADHAHGVAQAEAAIAQELGKAHVVESGAPAGGRRSLTPAEDERRRAAAWAGVGRACEPAELENADDIELLHDIRRAARAWWRVQA